MNLLPSILIEAQKSDFDPVVARYAKEVFSFTEEEALADLLWAKGEDAYLREDIRFRPTPWGRWMLADHYLANESVYRAFHREERSEQSLAELLTEISQEIGRLCAFCLGDPRFESDGNNIRLSEAELSNSPRVEEASELERYKTHLPLHTLHAVAASAPAGEWGSQRQEDLIETLGWIRVNLPGRGINERMFIARIKGHSMDNGRNGLRDGAYAVFELEPVGERSGTDVLVRGSFSDPEFGSYTIKRYQGEPRDANRERREIRLISLNPDKDRYPDIVLTAEDASDFQVIAKLVTPLDPTQFARRPKPPKPRRIRFRDLDSEQGRQRIERDLNHALENFFEREAGKRPDATDRSGWAARLVCLDAEADSLHVETDPLGGFPSFVKTLQLCADEERQTVIASNLRHRVWRIKIPPSMTGYHWEAPGFEDIIGDDLSRLHVAGLSAERVTVFRNGADGIGRLLSGNTLSPGQSYRLVLPPGLTPENSGDTLPIGTGWRLWELDLPGMVPPGLRDSLANLGLSLAKAAPRLEWVLAPPVSYRSNPAGESYPVFDEGDDAILKVCGIEVTEPGDMALFVAGTGSFVSLDLPPGDEWWLRMPNLPTGSYIVEAAHRNTAIQRIRLPFRVDSVDSPLPSCRWSLEIGGDSLLPDDLGVIDCMRDFRPVPVDPEQEERQPPVLQGPPCRRVDVYWDDSNRRWLGAAYIDSAGALDLFDAFPILVDLISRSSFALMELDLGEMGLARVAHRRLLDVDELAGALRGLHERKAASAKQLRGQFSLLRSLWLDELLSHLYHGISELNGEELDGLPTESGGAVIVVEKRLREGNRIIRQPQRIVVIAPTEESVLNAESSGLYRLADEACNRTGLRDAVITDGFVWGRHEPGRRLHLSPVKLSDALAEGGEAILHQFLYDHAITI